MTCELELPLHDQPTICQGKKTSIQEVLITGLTAAVGFMLLDMGCCAAFCQTSSTRLG